MIVVASVPVGSGSQAVNRGQYVCDADQGVSTLAQGCAQVIQTIETANRCTGEVWFTGSVRGDLPIEYHYHIPGDSGSFTGPDGRSTGQDPVVVDYDIAIGSSQTFEDEVSIEPITDDDLPTEAKVPLAIEINCNTIGLEVLPT